MIISFLELLGLLEPRDHDLDHGLLLELLSVLEVLRLLELLGLLELLSLFELVSIFELLSFPGGAWFT